MILFIQFKLLLFQLLRPSKLYQTIDIPPNILPLSHTLTSLHLYSQVAFPDIEKAGKSAIKIGIEHVPWFAVEDGFWEVGDDDPVVWLADVEGFGVGVWGHGGGLFEADRAHVVVVAVVDVASFFVFQPFLQILQPLRRINPRRYLFPMQFERYSSLPKHTKVFIQPRKPPYKRIISSKILELNVSIRRRKS